LSQADGGRLGFFSLAFLAEIVYNVYESVFLIGVFSISTGRGLGTPPHSLVKGVGGT
jgi:hypothetical protein